MIQPPRAGIAHVRVDTEIPAALPGGLLLVKGLERAAQSVPSGGGILLLAAAGIIIFRGDTPKTE